MHARLTLALAALMLVPAAAPAAPVEIRTGPWHGTAGNGELTFRVTAREGRREIRVLRTTSVDGCAISLDRVPVRPDGTFALSEGDVTVRGRFVSRRRATGTIGGAPVGLSCSGAPLPFTAVPGLSDLQRFGRCEDLTGRSLVDTDSARVVARRVHDVPRSVGVELVGRRYLGCALPGGVVHPLGDAGTSYFYDRSARPRRQPYSTQDIMVSKAAGRFVYVRTSAVTQQATFAEGRVVDLATGGGYDVHSRFDDGLSSPEPQELSAAAPIAWGLSPLGVFAGLFPDLADDFTDARSVRAFTESGAQKVLTRVPKPDIRVAGFGLDGRIVSWTQAAVPQSAEVTEATPDYAPGLEP